MDGPTLGVGRVARSHVPAESRVDDGDRSVRLDRPADSVGRPGRGDAAVAHGHVLHGEERGRLTVEDATVASPVDREALAVDRQRLGPCVDGFTRGRDREAGRDGDGVRAAVVRAEHGHRGRKRGGGPSGERCLRGWPGNGRDARGKRDSHGERREATPLRQPPALVHTGQCEPIRTACHCCCDHPTSAGVTAGSRRGGRPAGRAVPC